MKRELVSGTVGTILSATGTIIQPNEILEIVSLVITIIGGIITFIIMPLVSWYYKVKKDNKITEEEIREGVEIITTGLEKIDKKKKNKKEK